MGLSLLVTMATPGNTVAIFPSLARIADKYETLSVQNSNVTSIYIYIYIYIYLPLFKVTMNNLSSQNSINALECQRYISRVLAGILALQKPMEIPKTRLYMMLFWS